MNKKKLLSLTLALVLILPTTSFAKGNDNSHRNDKPVKQELQTTKGDDKSKGEEHKQEAEQNRTEKKQQIDAFKTQMKEKHTKMHELKKETKDLRHQIKQKKDQLSTILNDIQTGKKTLSEDMVTSLLTLSQSLQADADQVKATAEINNEVGETKAKVEKSDFNNALASMDKVIAKMHARLTALNKLNDDLDKALAIAKLATAPAAETPATTTTTPTNTTDSSTTNTTTTNSTGTSSTQ